MVIYKSMKLKARAKINLSIDIVGKRPDGYHEVNMIMQSIKLYDTIFIEPLISGVEVVSDNPKIPSGAGNIVYKAAKLIINKYDIKSGVKITIQKRIPIAAGLGGGSSDAAAVLRGINEMFSLNIPQQELMDLGKEIGADVPFCIKGGTALAGGIGEKLTALTEFNNVPIVIVKPNIRVSTPWVYKNLDLEKVTNRPDTELLLKAIRDRRVDVVSHNLSNVLEVVTAERYRVIKKIKKILIENGANGSLMSGSGPSVFGVFLDKDKANSAYKKIKKGKWDCFLTETIGKES